MATFVGCCLCRQDPGTELALSSDRAAQLQRPEPRDLPRRGDWAEPSALSCAGRVASGVRSPVWCAAPGGRCPASAAGCPVSGAGTGAPPGGATGGTGRGGAGRSPVPGGGGHGGRGAVLPLCGEQRSATGSAAPCPTRARRTSRVSRWG